MNTGGQTPSSHTAAPHLDDLCVCIRLSSTSLPLSSDHRVGPVVRRPLRVRVSQGSLPDIRSSHTSDLKIGTHWLPCQMPSIIESVLGLVGLVSVYSDRVRQL